MSCAAKGEQMRVTYSPLSHHTGLEIRNWPLHKFDPRKCGFSLSDTSGAGWLYAAAAAAASHPGPTNQPTEWIKSNLSRRFLHYDFNLTQCTYTRFLIISSLPPSTLIFKISELYHQEIRKEFTSSKSQGYPKCGGVLWSKCWMESFNWCNGQSTIITICILSTIDKSSSSIKRLSLHPQI